MTSSLSHMSGRRVCMLPRWTKSPPWLARISEGEPMPFVVAPTTTLRSLAMRGCISFIASSLLCMHCHNSLAMLVWVLLGVFFLSLLPMKSTGVARVLKDTRRFGRQYSRTWKETPSLQSTPQSHSMTLMRVVNADEMLAAGMAPTRHPGTAPSEAK